MKYIEKSKPPKSLIDYKSTPNASYEGCKKEDIRIHLIAEQGAICAYCMGRISNEWNEDLSKPKCEIEHFESQDTAPEKSLDYKNMLGVCNGSAGQPEKLQHCDTKKGNLPLSPLLNPLSKNIEEYISYSSNGRIKSNNKVLNVELNKVLNLNMQNLVNVRKSKLDIAMNRLKAINPKGNWRASDLRKELRNWTTQSKEGEFEPYCDIAIYFIEKWIRQADKRR